MANGHLRSIAFSAHAKDRCSEIHRSICASKNDATNPALSKPIVAEVDDQPQRYVHQLHVRKQLRAMTRHVHLVLVEALALHDQGAIHEAVDSELFVKGEPFVGPFACIAR